MVSFTSKIGFTALLCGSVLWGGTARHSAAAPRGSIVPAGRLVRVCAPSGHGEGANWAGYTSWPANPGGAYDAALPARPKGYSTDPAVVAAQTQRGAALVAAIQNAINAKQTSYTVRPGVYRFDGKGSVINVLRVHGFTLNAAGCVFILADSGAHLLSGDKAQSDPAPGVCSDITVQGSDAAPLIVDHEQLGKTQGTIQSYDPATGVMRVQIMPGYPSQVKPADDVTAYTSVGMDIPYGYYHSVYGKYAGGQTVDPANGIVQVTADRNDSARFAPGNFVTLPTPDGGAGVLGSFERTVVTNLTLKDIAIGTGSSLLDTWAGRLSGTTRLIRVKNGPIPGTNRLGAGTFSQTSSPRGSVLMDGCEFGGGYDDAMDIQSSGLTMYYKTSATNPNQMLVWQIRSSKGSTVFAKGDAITLYADKNFAKVYSATVTDVALSPDAAQADDAALADAARIWNSFKRRTKSGGSLVLLTLDKPVAGATPGDYIENDSDRMGSFTMTNCYWHQIGVRVMIEGIQSGTFTHNTFDGVNGGLALVVDPYWAQGGTCQNVTVSNNVFRDCNLDKVQGSGALVMGPYWGSGPLLPGQAYGFENFTVTHNTFIGPSLEAIHAHGVGNLNIAHNFFSIGKGVTIHLDNCGGEKVYDNRIALADVIAGGSLSGRP